MKNPTPSRTDRRWFRLACATACATLALSVVTACNIVGPAIAIASGPSKIRKAFDLPSEPITVVLVEDTASPPLVRDARLLRTIAETATEELTRRGVVRIAVEPGPIHVLSVQPAERNTPIADLAREVGAEQIIYAQIRSFTLSPDGQSFAPSAELRVRVLDASVEQDDVIGRRIFPADAEGHPLIAGGENIAGFSPRDAADVRQAELELAELTGLRLAQLFYDRDRDAVSRNRPGGE